MSDESRPARARGLKLGISIRRINQLMSRPARARGLKLTSTTSPIVGISRAPRGRVD